VKHIVSVSLGSSKRDKRSEVVIAGEPFLIERVGTDGDYGTLPATVRRAGRQVDALGVGGADLYIWVGDRRYTFRSIQRLVSVATEDARGGRQRAEKHAGSARRCAGFKSTERWTSRAAQCFWSPPSIGSGWRRSWRSWRGG
jgi:hypothetical protein